LWIPPTGLGSELDVCLEPGGEVAGVVVDESGAPLPRAKVDGGVQDYYQRLATRIINHRPFAATVADAEGRFRIGGLPSRPNEILLGVSADGYLPTHVKTAAPVSDLRVVLRSVRGPCSLQVRLRKQETDAALPPAGGSFVLEPERAGFKYRGEADDK